MYIRSMTPSHNDKEITLLVLELRSGLDIRSSLISILVSPVYHHILHLRTRHSTLVLTGYEPHAYLTLPSTNTFHDKLHKKNHLIKSIHTAFSNHSILGIYHSHPPLDPSLLPYRRRTVDHIPYYNLSTPNGRRIQ